jgi:NitT/TauT family transport system substrate-binding protein
MKNFAGKKLMAFVFIALFLITSHVTAQQVKLTFAPQWFPQAQFAGYYVALEKGFYKEAGLDVRIIHPSSTTTAFDYLYSGKADLISTFLVDGLKQRVKGKPIVHVGQFSQHSALMMITKKSSGISHIKDLNNKRLGIWSSGFHDIPEAFIRQNNYNIQLVPLLNTINLFLLGGLDALTAMSYNEYDQVINSGINEDELNTFYFSDYGFDVPEDGLYCLEKTYSEKRVAIEKFMKATLKGWEFASKNKNYAIDLVVNEMNKAHLPNNKAHQTWMLDKILEMIEPGNKNVKKGQLLDQDFFKALDIIKSGNDPDFKNTNIKIEDFCKPVF